MDFPVGEIGDKVKQTIRNTDKSTDKNRYKKKCGICKLEKEVVIDGKGGVQGDFGVRKKTRKDGTVGVYAKYMCRECEAEKVARWREKKAQAGELKDAQRQWEKARAVRLSKNPKKKARRRTRKIKRDRARRARTRKAAARPVFLPSAPLVEWLEALQPGEELDPQWGDYKRERAAEQRLRQRHIAWVSMDVADAILLAHDRTDLMARLWTDEELSGAPYWKEHGKERAAETADEPGR